MSETALGAISGLPVEIASFAILGCVYALLSLGLNVQWGETGLFNAGVAAFFAIGAYVTAILITGPSPPVPGVYPGHLGGFSWPWPFAALAAGAIAGFAGFLIAIPTLRLRTDYLAIATLGLGLVITTYLLNDAPVTGGAVGIYGIPGLFEGWNLPPGWATIFTALVAGFLVLLTYLLLWYLGRSPWARVLKSVREDEDAAEVLGKDTFAFKLQSFVLGCAIMGVAGAVFTVFLLFVEPISSFAPIITFTVWAMLILGGSGNHLGAILGAFVFYFMDWFSTRIQIQLSGTTGIPNTAPILGPPAALAVVVLPLLLLDVVLVALVLRPRWQKRGTTFRGKVRSLVGWSVGEAILAWTLYYSLLHPNYLADRIVFFRIMLVGLLLIVLVVYRPQGLLPEKLVTVRRRHAP